MLPILRQSLRALCGKSAQCATPLSHAVAYGRPRMEREDARRHLGRLGEQLAAEHLQRLGFAILARNYRTRWGELDIVAFDGTVLAFCEVKTRHAGSPAGTALEAVDPRKRSRVRGMARSWLAQETERPYAPALRFDAIGVTFDRSGQLVRLEHLEGAF